MGKVKGSVCLLGCLNSEMSVEGGCELRLIFYSTFLTREQFNSRELKYLARTADSFSTVIIARMSQRKWREIKQQPSRARSGKQISCCLVSLHFLRDILATIAVVNESENLTRVRA